MPAPFHRPVRRPPETFDNLLGSHDPAEQTRMAHATASALLARVRADDSGVSAERLVAYAQEHGIAEIAELWAKSPAVSLPGALWRLYLLQAAIHTDAELAALLHERGRIELPSVDALVAGAPVPAGPEELVALIDTILHGAFSGDFAVALERAAAFCRVQASGATHLADDYEPTEPERASSLTTRAARLSSYAQELSASASAWRDGSLN
ncbi:DNA-directed RNA polymerase subunit beta [Microbacterium capsulatum]|uniref:DNA-directed RNA polymerase subunit beta n=1 Tax=Microbacterium capsulatum TaxID=3041921 RepID=A0ABU0XGZ9_9MICO|nr:DNA-directed RNA polymerase subunit beta [Microbacterium sp. ASV81]MDQ4214404.1 DNA-directed RNA polymerase subunit beta [Microbacterium sp. ASV81]